MKHSINSKLPVNFNLKKILFVILCIIVVAAVIFLIFWSHDYSDVITDAKKDITKDKFIKSTVSDISCNGVGHNESYTYVKCKLKTDELKNAYGEKYVYYGQKELATGDHNYYIGTNLNAVKEKLGDK